MWLTKTCKYIFNAFLLLCVVSLQGHETLDCTLDVAYLKQTINLNVGQHLMLNCTVDFCSTNGQLSTVYWCKFSGIKCNQLNTHIHNGGAKFQNKTRMLVIYEVSSVNLNDSGTFQCQAHQGVELSIGHSITVHVRENPTEAPHAINITAAVTNNTMSTTQASMQTPSWILYCLIGLGVVAAIIFIVMITYFCLRNIEDPLESKEDRKKSKHSTVAEANGNSTIYENELPERPRFSDPNSIFAPTNKNHHTHSPSRPYTNQVCFINVPVDDPIIYASLNQSALSRKRSIIFTEEETTEYAAINIKV